MSRSICRFMPPKENDENIKAINFVFETEFAKLKQPFFAHVNILYLVTRDAVRTSVVDAGIRPERNAS